MLKDDKHYPYLKIDLAQDYPRVELVRRVEKDKAKYFGPYMGATGVREVLDVLRGLAVSPWEAYGMLRELVAELSVFSKSILCLSMLLGRLEMFTLLVMLRKGFWKSRSSW